MSHIVSSRSSLAERRSGGICCRNIKTHQLLQAVLLQPAFSEDERCDYHVRGSGVQEVGGIVGRHPSPELQAIWVSHERLEGSIPAVKNPGNSPADAVAERTPQQSVTGWGKVASFLQACREAPCTHRRPARFGGQTQASAEAGSSIPAALVSPQHDDMAPSEAAVLVELGKEGGSQVGVKVDNERLLSSLVPATQGKRSFLEGRRDHVPCMIR